MKSGALCAEDEQRTIVVVQNRTFGNFLGLQPHTRTGALTSKTGSRFARTSERKGHSASNANRIGLYKAWQSHHEVLKQALATPLSIHYYTIRVPIRALVAPS